MTLMSNNFASLCRICYESCTEQVTCKCKGTLLHEHTKCAHSHICTICLGPSAGWFNLNFLTLLTKMSNENLNNTSQKLITVCKKLEKLLPKHKITQHRVAFKTIPESYLNIDVPILPGGDLVSQCNSQFHIGYSGNNATVWIELECRS